MDKYIQNEGKVVATVEEWKALNETQRQFLREAAEVSMAHLVEGGEVIAWGPGLASFSMPVDVQAHPQDGYVVTLKEDQT